MEIIEDIVYGNEKLDLYLPENKDFDLFVYFHGGGLERGSKASRPHIYKHLASCGVAIGLALQGSLSNFAGGLMILFFKPFKVGDFIEASGESGVVTEITVVYTVLTTPDNKRVTIPNGSLTNSVIENYSAEPLRRVDLTFSTDYGCDIDMVKTVIGKLVEEHPLALAEPEPFVRLSAHGDSALTYAVRVWCKSEDYWTVHFDLTESVKKAFDQHDISIPYPQMDVHIKN